jgi:hypothetical protein
MEITENKDYVPIYRPAFLYGLKNKEVAFISKIKN